MKWLFGYGRLKKLGILAMNRRNSECILDLNPRHAYPVVDEKHRMHLLCQKIGVPTPDIYGIVETHSALRRLPKMLEPLTDFVIKPNRGAGGRGILVVLGKDGELYIRHNGKRMSYGELRQHVCDVISGLCSLGGRNDEVILQQRVVLDPQFQAISYQGIGDIRVIVYKKVPAMAMLRLPTMKSGGRANLHQGGIGAGIDMETGITTHAVMDNRVTEKHPDTGESVIGFQVPQWSEIIEMSRKVGENVDLGYVGVDIVLDVHRGPLLLEANARPGLSIQIANAKGLIPVLREIDDTLARNDAARRRES